MDNMRRLKAIQSMRDKTLSIYEAMRFEKANERKYFEKARLLKYQLDSLYKEYISEEFNGIVIYATEELIIENEQKEEIMTNLTGYKKDITKISCFLGYLPTEGHLGLDPVYDEKTGMHFYITNLVSKKVFEEHDVCGYNYCDPTSIRYFSPGIYKIPVGTELGYAFINECVSQNDHKRELKLIDISKK